MIENIKKVPSSFYIIAALIFSFVLRFYNLSYRGLWNDELFTAASVKNNHSFLDVISYVGKDVHPPLHNLLLKAWVELFSYNDFSMKMFSVCLGILGVYAVYQLSKLLFNQKVALITLLFSSVNFFLIYFSREVRAYSLFFVLSVYTCFFFILILRKPKSLKNIIGFIAISTMLIYTHYFGVFILIGLYFTLVQRMHWKVFKKNIAKISLVLLGPFILFLPWVPILLEQIKTKSSYWKNEVSINTIFNLYGDFFNENLLSTVIILFIIGLLLFNLFSTFFKRGNMPSYLENLKKSEVNFLIIILSIYFLIPFLKSLFSTSVMGPRYFIVMLAPTIILLSYALSFIKSGRILSSVLTGVFLYSLLVLFLKPDPYETNKSTYLEPIRDANSVGNEHPVLFMTTKNRNFEYYLNQFGFREKSAGLGHFKKKYLNSDLTDYFVFFDLKYNNKRKREVLDEGLFQFKGYEIKSTKIYKNMYNRHFVQFFHLKKK